MAKNALMCQGTLIGEFLTDIRTYRIDCTIPMIPAMTP